MSGYIYGGFHELPRKQLVWTIIGLQLSLLLASLDQTIVSTAMPKIIANLNGFDRYAWVTTAYMLTSTTAVPIFGKLSDMYGRKNILLLGTISFVLFSALCGLSGYFPTFLGNGMNQLIVFRGLQGISGGIIMALIFTVIGDIFPPAERGKYQGLFSAVFAFASVIGPTLGGWITDSLNWRWIFYVNMPMGTLAVATLYFAFPNIKPVARKEAIDYLGTVTMIGFVVPLLLALTWVVDLGWTAPSVYGMFILAAVMLTAFIFVESKAKEPIIPLSLFLDPIVTVASISLVIVGVAMFGTILFIPLFMQTVIGVSATKSGSLLTPMMLMMVLGSVTSGQLISRLGRYKIIALSGLTIMAVGMFMLSRMNIQTHEFEVVRNMMVAGIGLGLLMPVYNLVVQNVAPRNMIGAATASTQFFRSIGGTIGAAVFGSIMIARYLEALLKSLPQGTAINTVKELRNPLVLGMHEPIAASGSSLVLIHNDVRAALSYSLSGVFEIGTALVVITIFINLFLREVPLRKTHEVQAGTSTGVPTVAAIPPEL